MGTTMSSTIDAWLEYRSNKRTVLVLFIATVLVGAGVKLVLLRWALPLVVQHTNPAILLWAIPFVACFVAWFVAMVRFWLWKCPRCGRRFIGVYDAVAFLRNKCFYCGLPIGSDPASVGQLRTER